MVSRALLRLRGACGVEAFVNDRLAMEVSFSRRTSVLADDLLDDTVNLGVGKLRLGLSFERARQLHGDDGNQSFAHVVAGDARSFSLMRLLDLAKLLMTRSAQCETGEVRAPSS